VNVSGHPHGLAALVLLLSLTVAVGPAEAQGGTLFAEPLHLTREVSDPISGSTSTLDEYCLGDRVVSIRESKVSIADYGKSTLTVIDHAQGTYSVTTFDAIARALASDRVESARKAAGTSTPELTDSGTRPVAGRGGRAFAARIADPSATRSVEVVVDREVMLSREAIEVLVGAAFPLRGSPESEIAIAAAGRDRAAGRTGSGLAADYALPLEQTVTWDVEGESLRLVNRVVRVGRELAPIGLIAIPPGARQVESDIVARRKMLDELDRLPSTPAGALP
jgi:hypothetical protein